MQLWQPEIQDQQVELVRGQCGVGLAAGADLIDRIARGTQRAQQAVSQHLVVLGNQDAHASSPA